MRLYGYWRSSATWRVRLGLQLKGIDYAVVPVHLLRDGGEHRMLDHTQRNLMQQVPVLEFDGPAGAVRLTQSVAILEWLEESHPEPSLLPADPLLRARTRQAVEIVNSGIQPLQNLSVLGAIEALGGDKVAFAQQAIAKGLAALEALVDDTAGTCLIGDQITLAEVLMVPQLYNARRSALDLSPYPTLVRVDAAVAAVPAFVAAHPDQQPDAA